VTPSPFLPDQDYARFRRLIDEESGLDFPPSRRSHLEHAIKQAMTRSNLPDVSNLYERLREEGGRSDLESLVATLTVGETHFFRNRPQFEALENRILPELIRRRAQERRLRIWSAGCSSGEEPYSLAMLLDRLVPNLADWNLLILATDIDRRALRKAHEGSYSPWSFREVPGHIEARYFTTHGRHREVVPRIRDMVTFEYLNLVGDEYPSLLSNTNAMDLVLCRNVLIYFREDVVHTVVGRLYEAISDEGWLLVGHSEPSQLLFDRFSVQNFPGTTVYRKTEADSRKRSPVEPKTSARVGAGPSAPSSRRETRRPPRSPTQSRPQATGRLAEGTSSEVDACEEALKMWSSGRVEEALHALETVAAEETKDARPAYLVAKIHAGRLDVAAAEAWIESALTRDPLFAPAHYLRGLVSEEEGHPDEAVASLRRCIYADPRWPLGHFALAGSLLRLGEKRRATKALHNMEQLLEGRPVDEPIVEGDGITVSRLRELATIQKEIFGLEATTSGGHN
jgi:chemotaxis protein methyltransferase CheR